MEEADLLADRLRPRTLDEFVGQTHLTGPQHSARSSGYGELTTKNIIFWDKFIPFFERGFVQIIGATTENPSFELNRALIHLLHILQRLTDADVFEIFERAVLQAATPNAGDDSDAAPAQLLTPSYPEDAYPTHTSSPPLEDTSRPSSPPPSPPPIYPQLTRRVKASITSLSSGDARTALSLLELVLHTPQTTPESALLDSLRRSVSTSYDRTGDSHYDLISALHKSVRGSQPDAALYWLARMLEAGETPVYVARRMVVCASEDIGAMAALQACQMVGMPGCGAQLAETVAYLAEAPKSTCSYEAYNRAEKLAKRDLTLSVPLVMRVMEVLECEAYMYPPEYRHPVKNEYLPRRLHGEVILRREGDLGDKLWNEDALRRWEDVENGGQEWVGRPHASTVTWVL
ncbi:DNA polymerase III, clamp loader complex, gamma/delta/delta subunit [Lactarius quietus]|nr:DNA polymerase III, clamp loader complex, gamma/delta/delta subunit [Lactarius quietus]